MLKAVVQYLQGVVDDLQANFSFTVCHLCGMMYAKGQQKDEKLHNKFHRSCELGVQLQVWACGYPSLLSILQCQILCAATS